MRANDIPGVGCVCLLVVLVVAALAFAESPPVAWSSTPPPAWTTPEPAVYVWEYVRDNRGRLTVRLVRVAPGQSIPVTTGQPASIATPCPPGLP